MLQVKLLVDLDFFIKSKIKTILQSGENDKIIKIIFFIDRETPENNLAKPCEARKLKSSLKVLKTNRCV